MSHDKTVNEIKQRIKVFPDFPKKGIDFKDIFPLFQQPSLLNDTANVFADRIKSQYPDIDVDVVVGLDSRGFLFAPTLAGILKATFVPLRKKGKLPGEVLSVKYALEYGEDAIEVQSDAVEEGSNVVIIDDLLATGGTMAAACKLLNLRYANILECQCVIELTGLNGRERLPKDVTFYSIVQYEF